MSDLHLERAPLELPDPGHFDIAVLAGDIAWPGSAVPRWVRSSRILRARAVVWVPGNHEYFDAVLPEQAQAMREAASRDGTPPLHLLDGDAVVIDGVRFVGCTLWTDFLLRIDTPDGLVADPERARATAGRQMADYRVIGWPDEAGGPPRRLRVEDTLAMHRAQRDWLFEQLCAPFDGPTVVVTHHGPHRGSYLSELPEACFGVPRLWVHGHTHTSRDYRVGACRVLCNPRGYATAGSAQPENAEFDAACVVEVAAR